MSQILNTKRLDKEALSTVQVRYAGMKRKIVLTSVTGAVLIALGLAVKAMSNGKSFSMDMMGSIAPILGMFCLLMSALGLIMRPALKTYLEEREIREGARNG